MEKSYREIQGVRTVFGRKAAALMMSRGEKSDFLQMQQAW